MNANELVSLSAVGNSLVRDGVVGTSAAGALVPNRARQFLGGDAED